MEINKLKWRDGEHSSVIGYIGALRLFFISRNALRSREEALNNPGTTYILSSTLPQIKKVYGADQEELKKKAQKQFEAFMKILIS